MSRFTLIDARGRPAAPAPGPAPMAVDRREALAWMASGAALALASCGKRPAEIVPYVETPDGVLAGTVQRYATTLPLAGYGRGVTGFITDGRPTKLEGSALHPASLGSTDVFAEAEILGLYDPARARTVETADGPAAWSSFQSTLIPRLALARSKGGAGLTVVTGRITSPTEQRLMAALRQTFPAMAWRRYEPVDDDGARGGARLAFGRVLDVRPGLDKARVTLCLDADPLGPGPDQIAQSRAFASVRREGRAPFLRLYAVEPGWSLTGMNADHRLALRPELIRNVALVVAGELGATTPAVELSAPARRFAEAAAADLIAAKGAAVVLVGRSQPAEVHTLAHWINARLQAPVEANEPVDPHPEDHAASLRQLSDDLHSGRVETLITLGANPLYDAPAELELAQGWTRVPFTAAAGLYPAETGAASHWRLPLAHPLESWGDLRSVDGAASLVQPLVRPLHDGRSGAELLAMLNFAAAPKGLDLVRETWASRGVGDAFEGFWKRALTDGVVADSAPARVTLPEPKLPVVPPARPTAGPVLTLAPDPTLYDGRFAANAWLQECPKPLTHEVWGATVAVSPTDAARLAVKDGDHLAISRNGRKVEAAVRITAGQPEGVVSAFLGGGRQGVGPVGDGVGVDFAPVRNAASPWTTPVEVAKAKGRGAPPTFSTTHRLEGEARKLSPVLALNAAAKAHPAKGELDRTAHAPSLYPDLPAHDPAWAMVIDAAACTGCNACVVACQAENNVPVVGPHEVARGRDMHWLRIDAYDVADEGRDPRLAFQPVPCMQCEHAPCEPVCPVEASVHDHEGLNAQVYNRCIGTRFCQSNCPYKVRRFNFHGYSDGQTYANMGDEALAAQKNPEVTVRARGVMEKCTYCVQRISAARRTAEKEDRPLGDGEVVTACQSACPTRAIAFGNLAAKDSAIHALRAEPRHYALLGELGTRPRTTYLARLRNPNPVLGLA